jgi:predicted transcriptional regulator
MTREELKKSIPHGYCKKIAVEAGVTTKAVSQFLSGKSNSLKIELAALKVIGGIEMQKSALMKKITK